MWILIISLIALAVVAAIAGIVRNRKLQKKIDNGELDAMPEVQEVDIECCGQHEVCEKESLLAAVSKKIEYYDDSRTRRRIPRCLLHHAVRRCSGLGTQPATARHRTAGQHKG